MSNLFKKKKESYFIQKILIEIKIKYKNQALWPIIPALRRIVNLRPGWDT
jgi:hypothetical protein